MSSFWEQVTTKPDTPAMIGIEGETLTYAQSGRMADKVAALFAELGLKPGDTISVVSENVPMWMVTYVAVLQSGLYFTPLGPKSSADQLASIWHDSDTKAVVFSAAAAPAAKEAADRVGIPDTHRFCIDDQTAFPNLAAAAETCTAPTPPRRAGMRSLYTGGTTGAPRRIRHPLPTITPEEAAAPIIGAPLLLGMRTGDSRHLVAGPLYHGGPLAYATAALHLGATLVMPRAWATEAVLSLIQDYRISSSFMVPTMLSRMVNLPPAVREAYDVSSMEAIIHGAAPCPPVVKQRVLDWFGPVVYEFYAATEAGGTYVSPQDWLLHPGTVGRALPGATVLVVDEEGNKCEPGTVGRIMMRSRTSGELVWPGDLGYLTEDGWLYLTDRVADVIISGGVNVYSAQVEAQLSRVDGVEHCAVVGVPDPDWGEAVLAVIVPSWEPAQNGEREERLRDVAQRYLAPAQRPKRYLLTSSLPMTNAGKVDKKALRELYGAPVQVAGGGR